MFVEVALPLSLYKTFTYRLNNQIDPKSLIGRRVLVPFGKLKYYGFITDITENVPKDVEIRDVLHIDEFNTFTEREVQLIKEISDFYVSPVGLTAYYFAPNYLKGKRLEDPFYGKIFRLNLYTELPKNLSLTKKQLVEVVSNLGEVSFTQLKMFGFKKSTIQSLLKDGVLTEVKLSETTTLLRQDVSLFDDDKKLTLESVFWFRVGLRFGKGMHSFSFLPDLDRLRLIANISTFLLRRGNSSLIILPSVLAVNQYYQFLSRYIPNLKTYHDALPQKAQLEVWLSMMKEPGVVVGTMSSLLLPAKNLKLVCVECEHSNSYRSPMTPKFEAKRVAYMLEKIKSVSVVYGDKLPSLESYMMFKAGKIFPLKFRKIPRKQAEIIKFCGFSEALRYVEKILRSSGDTLIIANKSYYAAYVHCERCGFEWLCGRCGVYMRLMKKDGIKVLKCPKCGKEETYHTYCPDCDNRLTEEGFGSHKIVDYLRGFDVSIYEEFKDTRIKVISSVEGKVMVEKYDTVINIYPDFLLYLDRYDANEQFFRAVLTPMFIKSDRYIVFSKMDKNATVYKILKGEEDISKIYEEELSFRKRFRYPPVERYTKLEFWANREISVRQLKETLRPLLKSEDIKFEYQKGTYYKIILKSVDRDGLKRVYEKFSGKGRLSIEVNTKNI